jgi:hypothetical protein
MRVTRKRHGNKQARGIDSANSPRVPDKRFTGKFLPTIYGAHVNLQINHHSLFYSIPHEIA